MYNFWVRCIKTLSFYNEFDIKQVPCFIVVFVRAQTAVFSNDFDGFQSRWRAIDTKPYIFTMIYARLRTIVKMHIKNTLILL